MCLLAILCPLWINVYLGLMPIFYCYFIVLYYFFFEPYVVQLLIHVWFCVTPWTAACRAFLSFTISLSMLKFMSIESVMASNHFSLCRPLLFLPSTFPSIRVFSNESALHIRCPKYWSFSFNISPSMNIQDWFPLALTGLISLQSKGLPRVFSNTTVQKHQHFGAELSLQSNSHIHTWLLEKTIALTRRTLPAK